jgi:hypothetical protein
MPHLWLALSPHGYGHAAMTAPLVAELRRRRPGLRLTIQTALPRDYLATRYADFDYVGEVPDIGFRMHSATAIDCEASAAFYRGLHADFAAVVDREAARLRAVAPDLVLANVPYVTIAAAAQAGIPVAAYSSLNWADLVDHYLGGREDCRALRAEIHESYAKATVFLRPTPAQVMTLPNVRDIGPVAVKGVPQRAAALERLGVGPGTRLGLIAFGGIDHHLPLERWPALEGWFWLSSLNDTPRRPDMARWEAAGLSFADLLPSVDLLVTKPGYGTFTEAGLAGVPVLYQPRPDWPESGPLEEWLARHGRCLPADAGEMIENLPVLLQKLFSQAAPEVASATGIAEGADVLEALLSSTI